MQTLWASAPPYEWHFGGHNGHELHVGFQWQAGHVDDRLGDVLDVHGRLDHGGAAGLGGALGFDAGGEVGIRVPDIDLAAGNVVLSPVQGGGAREAGDGMFGGGI